MTKPTITETEVSEAYEAFAAMRRLVYAEPHLANNKFYMACQDAAAARFLVRYKAS